MNGATITPSVTFRNGLTGTPRLRRLRLGIQDPGRGAIRTRPRRLRARRASHRSSGKPLRRESERLGEFARKGLVADDERQLHDLGLRKVRPEPGKAEVAHLAVFAGDAFGKLERCPLSRGEAGVVGVSGEGGERLDG